MFELISPDAAGIEIPLGDHFKVLSGVWANGEASAVIAGRINGQPFAIAMDRKAARYLGERLLETADELVLLAEENKA